MKLIICGGRDHPRFTESGERAFLDALHAKYGFQEVITGGAPGADTEGDNWAETRGIQHIIIPANWTQHGAKAGPIRNSRMAAYASLSLKALCVAFPGGRGTADMIAKAHGYGIPVLRYPEDHGKI